MIVIIFILSILFSSPNSIFANENQDVLLWGSVQNFLKWEKKWYGTFYNEKCYNEKLGKNATISYEENIESNRLINKCTYSQRLPFDRKVFYVGIDNTVLQYKIIGFTGEQNQKLRADSIPVESSMRDECIIEGKDQINKKEKFNILITEINNENNKAKYNDDIRKIVNDAVKRSIESYIKNTLPSHKEDLSSFIKEEKTFFLAWYDLSDPFLLVYFPEKQQVYKLDFPSVDVLKNTDYCMEIYSAGIYLGSNVTSNKKEINEALVKKIKIMSTPLKIFM